MMSTVLYLLERGNRQFHQWLTAKSSFPHPCVDESTLTGYTASLGENLIELLLELLVCHVHVAHRGLNVGMAGGFFDDDGALSSLG